MFSLVLIFQTVGKIIVDDGDLARCGFMVPFMVFVVVFCDGVLWDNSIDFRSLKPLDRSADASWFRRGLMDSQ